MKNKAAFTIIEIFLVIVILGVLACFAVPNYILGLSRTYARNAVDNLVSIQSAQLIYIQANGSYYESSYQSNNPAVDDSPTLNSRLNLNITPNGGTKYYCDSTPACHAVRTDTGAFDIQLNLRMPIVSVGRPLIYCDPAIAPGGPSPNNNPCCLNTKGYAKDALCPAF